MVDEIAKTGSVPELPRTPNSLSADAAAAFPHPGEIGDAMDRMVKGMQRISKLFDGKEDATHYPYPAVKVTSDRTSPKAPVGGKSVEVQTLDGKRSTTGKVAETKKPQEIINGVPHQRIDRPDFLDAPISRRNITVRQPGGPDSKEFKFDCALGTPCCQKQPDKSVLRTGENVSATIKLTADNAGRAQKIEFKNFENVRGDGGQYNALFATIDLDDTRITDAVFERQGDSVKATYDLDLSTKKGIGLLPQLVQNKLAKNRTIDGPPSAEDFQGLAEQCALRLMEQGFLENGRHPELRRLAEQAKAAELASTRKSPQKALGG